MGEDLHPELNCDGEFYACQRPEQPRVAGTRYDSRCRGCRVGMEAHLRLQDDAVMVWEDVDTGEYVTLNLSEALEIAKERYG